MPSAKRAVAIAPKTSPFSFGAIQGRITLPENIISAAGAAGAGEFLAAQLEDFNGESVRWLEESLPGSEWMTDCRSFFPEEAVWQLGFKKRGYNQDRFYSTHGVDMHTDEASEAGAVFVLVLANDGLTFRQGGQQHATRSGEWYIFDDRVLHGVKTSRKSTSYVFWHVPLVPNS